MTKTYYDEEMSRQQKKVAMTTDMRKQREVVLEKLALKPGEHVLDLGSGNGIFCQEIQEIVGPTGHVTGIDNSDVMIAMAADICPQATFVKGDATALDIANESLDAVTTAQLLCFVPDIDKALSEIFRVLKPGGRLVILDTDWGTLVWNCSNTDLMTRVMAALKSPYADEFVPRTLSRRLKAAGFSVTDRVAHTILNFEPDPDTYSQQMAGYVEPIMKKSQKFASGELEQWKQDLEDKAARGEYMFSINRMIFSATKPS